MVAPSAAEQHYMKSSMVDSQLDLLEDPVDETDFVVLDSSQSRENMLESVVQTVQDALAA
ncbi:hypothetical protein NUU61_003191 [Penicillium alfredii]|uniref:Gluconate kinase n=1 Tax=Penicillium alfredii TaxID=1506179 RepID=A0A9W9FT34_9EURO|nr:uncharacterized protein NUU61_003191 [Penicillium alfredii]KAJ5105844.1 hypothetical protein NUU61_003191 [Penicillium alfredii]